jgi:hypothetical protein
MRVGILFLLLVFVMLISCVPQEKSLESEIKESLVGYEISYYNFAGQEMFFTITESDIISIEDDFSNKLNTYKAVIGDSLSWNLYLDKETLEVVRTEQLFVT